VTDQAARRDLPAFGLVAADGLDQPTLGVADLQQRIGEAVSAAFPDRLWLCGEVVGTPAVRGGGAGIAFTLAESHGSTVLTLRAWLGRPYYQQLRQQLGDAAITELLTVGNLVVVGGWLQYGGPFSSLELKVDRVVRTPAGPGAVTQQREALQQDLAGSGLLGRQRATVRLPLAPRRVGIVAGGAGMVGYTDAVAVLAQSGFEVATTHFPAPLEGEAAPTRIAAQIRAAGVGNQAVLVVRGGGEDAQLSPFDSAPVVSAIATAPVPVITGIGHSHHDTLADAAAWQACVSPAAAAAVVAERLQRADARSGRWSRSWPPSGAPPRPAWPPGSPRVGAELGSPWRPRAWPPLPSGGVGGWPPPRSQHSRWPPWRSAAGGRMRLVCSRSRRPIPSRMSSRSWGPSRPRCSTGPPPARR
jgi:exodeoxyribonuclease VII large subunit